MSSQPHILLVDDDPILAQTLSEHLAASGYEVTQASSVEHGLRLAPMQDAVVVNDQLAGAAELCAELDAMGQRILVVGGPLEGAAANVPKPLRLGALLARIADLLRQSAANSRAIRFGPWRMDVSSRQLTRESGQTVRLTDKEAAILAFLAAAGGAVTRDRLLTEVWGYSSEIATHTLETHIYRLRRKIEADPADARLLITEDGGYRLVLGI